MNLNICGQHGLGRYVMLTLGAQTTGAAQLAFATPDRSVQGVLKTSSPAHTEFEPETMDPVRLLDAIAPCGPFAYTSPRRFWRHPQGTTNFVPVSHLPGAYSIALMGANLSTHQCVRAASWDAARHAGGGVAPTHYGVFIGCGLIFVMAGANVLARVNGQQEP